MDFIPVDSFGAMSQVVGAAGGGEQLLVAVIWEYTLGFHSLPQGPEAVLGQLEGYEIAVFSRRPSRQGISPGFRRFAQPHTAGLASNLNRGT